jgi:hypothetical protein
MAVVVDCHRGCIVRRLQAIHDGSLWRQRQLRPGRSSHVQKQDKGGGMHASRALIRNRGSMEMQMGQTTSGSARACTPPPMERGGRFSASRAPAAEPATAQGWSRNVRDTRACVRSCSAF